uniref:Glutamine amidotransferase domain-containing protein n=2 Tax=Aegilops tauschii subsp. strangulata TaxID=200361 RepID=A0A453IGX7_AEGTS
ATGAANHPLPCSVGRPKGTNQRRRPASLSVRASSDANTVTLLDYGAGNVRSVRNAIRHLGFNIRDVRSPEDILAADRLVFPGVGAFGSAMDVLNRTGMADALREYIRRDRPFLGICLGLQLLFDSSEENGPVSGLGVIPGVVRRFDSSEGLIVPHIGWNALQITKDTQLLQGADGHHVYFVHSYHALPSDANRDWISSTCNYGESFISSISMGNIEAVQFHPEKSGATGLSIFEKFLSPNSSGAKVVIKSDFIVCTSFYLFLFNIKFTLMFAMQAPAHRKASKLAKRVIACLDVRSNDNGDLVVTKGDQYDVRDHSSSKEVRNLGKPVELASQYYIDGADEVSFLNITGFRAFPLGDLPMLEVCLSFITIKYFHYLPLSGEVTGLYNW